MNIKLLFGIAGYTALLAGTAMAGGDGSAENPGNLNAALLVSNCVVCHGQNGESLGHTPSLNKMNKFQMTSALMEFKEGTRKGTIMPRIAPGYTDAQIETIVNELTGN